MTLASESLFRYLTPPLEKELRNNGRSLLTDQTKKNLVRTFGTHSGARVKFPSITKVYGSDQEFNVKVNYHGRKFRNTRIQIAIGGSTEEECKGNGCIMTKTRSRYASSVPRKRGHPSVVTTITCEHAIDGSKPQCSSIRKTLFT